MAEPIKMPLSTTESQEKLKKFLRERLTALKSGLKDLHETKQVVWRKAYEAIPAEKTREFPFHNASNLVVPVIAIHSDTLLARVMAGVFKTRPLWTTALVGEFGEDAHEMKMSVEDFCQFVGLESTELDLYRVYHEYFGEAIRLGTSVLKCPYEKKYEDEPVPSGEGGGKFTYDSTLVYSGPRPEKLAFDDFFISPSAKTIREADFKAHRVRLQKHQLEERAFKNIYDRAAVLQVIKTPDRTSVDANTASQQSDSGARDIAGYGWAEWDVYECHFKYRIDSQHYVRCIVWFHLGTSQILRAYFNYYPKDVEIFISCRLFFRDDQFHGYGFAERLWMLQEEISEIHNGRRDNQTVANTRVWRADPDSKVANGDYKIFPSAILPAMKDELEAMGHGEISPMAIDEERLSLELAEKLSGVQAPMQGMGSGVMSKRGVYSAMGTLSLLQEGNTRTDLNVTDIRYSHTEVGRTILRLYAEEGGDQQLRKFGRSADKIRKAFDLIKQGRLAIPVYAATASVNREVEKQNDVMLSGILMRHYQAITGMLQQITSPMIDQAMKTYLMEAMKAADLVMKTVMIHFGYDEVGRFVPDSKLALPQGSPPGTPPSPGNNPGQPGLPQGAPQGGPPGAVPPGTGQSPLDTYGARALLQSIPGGGGVKQ